MCARKRSGIHFFFFNDTATTEIYTLSLHDALPISPPAAYQGKLRTSSQIIWQKEAAGRSVLIHETLKRLRSEEHTSELSHANISYAVFCLKKKKLDRCARRQDQHRSQLVVPPARSR